MGSVMVPLDKALPSFLRLSIVTILLFVMVCQQFAMQILTGGSDCQLSFSNEGNGVLSNTMLPGTTMSNGFSRMHGA